MILFAHRLRDQLHKPAMGLLGRDDVEPHVPDPGQKLREPDADSAHVLPRERELLAGGDYVSAGADSRERVPEHELLRHGVQRIRDPVPVAAMDCVRVHRRADLHARSAHVPAPENRGSRLVRHPWRIETHLIRIRVQYIEICVV